MARKRCCFDVETDVDERFNDLCNEKGRKKSRFLELLMRLAIEHYDGILQLATSESHEEYSAEKIHHDQQNTNSTGSNTIQSDSLTGSPGSESVVQV